MVSDPTNGEWSRLDESPAASAQMIQWHAPETYRLIVAAALNGAAGEIDLLAQNKYHRFGAAHGDEVDRTFIVAYQRAARIVRNHADP